MAGPTELIRQNCPPVVASSGGVGGNDGLLTAQQYEQLLAGAGGGVTSLTQGTGIALTPNPITGVGSVALANTAVTPGSYRAANITVDAQGRITAASSGTDLKWFDVTDPAYGAVGDFDLVTGTLVTDDGPAILAAIKAATTDWSSAFAQRFGVVYFPPCAKGKGYGVSTSIALTITQGGAGTGGALHFDLLGCGADGPIVCATGTGVKTMDLIVSGLEWFMGSVRNLAFVTSHLPTPGIGTDCSTALKLTATVGKWIVDELHGIGVVSEGSVFEFNAGNYEIGTIHNAGCTGGVGSTFCHMNQSHLITLRSIFSYPEFLYQGVDNNGNLGSFQSLIKIEPSQDASWGPTSVIIENFYSDVSSQYAMICQKYSGTIRVARVQVNNWHIPVNTYGFSMSDVDYVDIGPGIWSAGVARQLLYAANFTRIRMTGCKSTTVVPDIYGDGSGTLILEDVSYGTITNTGGVAFVTTNGICARLRIADGAVIANTLAKMSASVAGRAAQFTTADAAALISGVFLDGGADGVSVRVVEQGGQQVPIKSDGSGTIPIGAGVDPSPTANGRVRSGTGILGVNAGALVAATVDALCEVL